MPAPAIAASPSAERWSEFIQRGSRCAIRAAALIADDHALGGAIAVLGVGGGRNQAGKECRDENG